MVFLTVSAAWRLMASGLARGNNGRMRFACDRLLPGEDPVDAAERVLTEVAGVRTAVHRPVLIGAFARESSGDDPMVVLSFVAFGRIENSPDPEWSDFCLLDGSHADRFEFPEVLNLAVGRIRELVWTSDIAGRVAANKYGLFTLRNLRDVFEAVMGLQLDPANFRRRAEAIVGLLDDQPEDQHLHPVGSSYRDRPRGRGRKPTVYRIGQFAVGT